jgi:hypothetical protein
VIPVAKHVETKLVDDIDGAEAAETVLFSLDAASYEIDLSTQHAAKLRDTLAPYVAAARRAGGSTRPARRQTATAAKRLRDDLREARAWLAEHGYPIKERGRINDAWLADYDAKSPYPPQQSAAEEETPNRRSKVQAPVFQAV